MADQPMSQWVAPPGRGTAQPHLSVVPVLCTPLAVSFFVAFFGLVLAVLGAPLNLFLVGVVAAIGQGLMVDRMWDPATGMGRGRLVGVLAGYLLASALLLIVGIILFPDPL